MIVSNIFNCIRVGKQNNRTGVLGLVYVYGTMVSIGQLPSTLSTTKNCQYLQCWQCWQVVFSPTFPTLQGQAELQNIWNRDGPNRGAHASKLLEHAEDGVAAALGPFLPRPPDRSRQSLVDMRWCRPQDALRCPIMIQCHDHRCIVPHRTYSTTPAHQVSFRSIYENHVCGNLESPRRELFIDATLAWSRIWVQNTIINIMIITSPARIWTKTGALVQMSIDYPRVWRRLRQ